MTDAIEALSPQWQQVLFVDAGQTKLPKIGSAGLCWPAAAEDLRAFRATADLVAQRARLYAKFKRTQVPSGPGENISRGESQKRHAVNCAFDLIKQFGNAPPKKTLSNLASIFYEGFTGIDNENLDRQCRAIMKLRETK